MPYVRRVDEIYRAKDVVKDCKGVLQGEAVALDHIKKILEVAFIEVGYNENVLETLISVFILLNWHNDINELWCKDIIRDLRELSEDTYLPCDSLALVAASKHIGLVLDGYDPACIFTSSLEDRLCVRDLLVQ